VPKSISITSVRDNEPRLRKRTDTGKKTFDPSADMAFSGTVSQLLTAISRGSVFDRQQQNFTSIFDAAVACQDRQLENDRRCTTYATQAAADRTTVRNDLVYRPREKPSG
jgi:hypothetical protein